MMSFKKKKKRFCNLKNLKTRTKTTVLVILFLGQLHEIPILHAWETLSFTEIPSHQILRDTPDRTLKGRISGSISINPVFPQQILWFPQDLPQPPSPVSPFGEARLALAPVVVAARGSCSGKGEWRDQSGELAPGIKGVLNRAGGWDREGAWL